jgi:transposase
VETVDGRSLSREALHERPRQVVQAYKRGLSKAETSRQLGVSYPAVCTTTWRYERQGAGTLSPKQRGRQVGTRSSGI